MSFNSFKYLIKEGLKGVWRNRVMTLISVGSVSASLLILGLFMVLAVNIDNVSKEVESQVTIEVFLEDEIDEDKVKDIGKVLKAMDGIEDITYISKDDALERMEKLFGDKKHLLEMYKDDDNPFPRSYVVQPKALEYVGEISRNIEAIEGVEEIKTGTEVANKISQSTNAIRIIMLIIIGILTLISVFIISNTIKLSVTSRSREIGIMKYIGATDGFVKMPFFVEGMALGLIGSLLAVAVIAYGYKSILSFANPAIHSMFSFYLVPFDSIIKDLTSLLIALGIGIGTLGTTLTVRKFLKV
jgi:cell division transport system permease protein